MTATTSPKQFLGHAIGEDFFVAGYTELVAYWRRLEAESPRLQLVDIGETGEGRRQYMLVISSPANLARLGEIRDIARRLARPYALDRAEATALAARGKAIVFIDGGVHHNEIMPTQALFEQAWVMASSEDAETLRILDEVVLLLVLANPDGHEDFAREYMRETDPLKRPVEWRFAMPRLMPKYAGSEINRDYHFMAIAETRNVNAVLYREWFAQVAYDPHQTGPLGVAMYVPPFREPNNTHTQALVLGSSNELGMAVHNRLVGEGKAGTYMGTAAPYAAWANGMSTSTCHLHNVTGILSELIGTPHPQRVPFVPARQMPGMNQPLPLEPGEWRAATTIAYQLSAHRAVLDWAARNRERVLMGFYTANRNAIEAGSRDHWTISARHVQALESAAANASRPPVDALDRAAGLHIGNLRGWKDTDPALYRLLRDPAQRDARGYILPVAQGDFPNAVEFANVLLRAGVIVERATSEFTVDGKSYGAGSLVVRTNQPYRPHILDMFEPQDWPTTPLLPGGPPQLPYDAAGYTVALQMGVVFDRILDGFDGQFAQLADPIDPPAGELHGGAPGTGFVVGCETNNSFALVNRLLKAGIAVSRLPAARVMKDRTLRPGAFWVESNASSDALVREGVRTLGVDAWLVPEAPTQELVRIDPPRIGLFDRFGGIHATGWLHWLFNRFEFPCSSLFPGELANEDWIDRFDVLFLPQGAFRGERLRRPGEPVDTNADYAKQYHAARIAATDIPEAYRHMLGDPDEPRVLEQITRFLRKGGTVVASGSSIYLAESLGVTLPGHDGQPFVPMSVLSACVDNTQPLAWGLGSKVNVVFNKSPLFRLPDGGKQAAWFDGDRSVVSGFAQREGELRGACAAADLSLFGGRLVLLGPETNFRGQSAGAFKFLFNAALPARASE